MSATKEYPPREAARRALARRLRFGDPIQCQALAFMRDIQAARVAMADCNHDPCSRCQGNGCAGAGSNSKWPCDECEGTGRDNNCRCFKGLNGAAVMEARRQMKGDN